MAIEYEFSLSFNTVKYSLPSNCVYMRHRKREKRTFLKIILHSKSEVTIRVIYELYFNLRGLKKTYKNRSLVVLHIMLYEFSFKDHVIFSE